MPLTLKRLSVQPKAQFPLWKIGNRILGTIILFLAFSPFGQNKNLDPNSPLPYSEFADPQLIGPETLCIVFGGVIGTFSAGGDPGDVYTWVATDPSGNEIFNRTGGGAGFETVKIAFNQTGTHRVSLRVRRATQIIYEESQAVVVQKGPELALLPDYLICGNNPVELTAIDPETPNLSEFTFIWRDLGDNIIGNQNTILVSREGFYKVELFQVSSTGAAECLINGSTYVGPSLDFELQLGKGSLCQGESQTLSTDTPLPGDWFLIKPGGSNPEALGSAFEVSLPSSEIEEPGIYTAIFSAIDERYPDCRSERRISFEVREAPELEATVLEKPDNCVEPNGSFEITALSNLDSIRVVERDYLNVGLSSGSSFILSNLDPQIYTILAYSNGCKFSTLLNLETKEPPIVDGNTPTIQEPSYQVEPESCGERGVIPGKLRLEFAQGEVNGDYRIMALGTGEVAAGEIQDQSSLELNLSSGTYLVELKVDGCTYPVEQITIDRQPQVSFSNPGTIAICEEFEFTPETSEDLIFTLQDPEGNIFTAGSGESFLLNKSGTYTLLGESNQNNGNCPREVTFEASLNQKINFDLELFEEDCFGNQVYRATVEDLDIAQTSIRWLNEDGEIVGRGELFYPTAVGNYTLSVQPLASGFCEIEPIPFSVEPPVLSVPVELEATKICPDPATAVITLTTDEDEVDRIEWIFFDLNDNREDLPQYSGLYELTVDRAGSYEAVVFNDIGCEIGRNFIEVSVSTLISGPELEDTYAICSKENTLPGINPGSFEEYAWYFEGDLVSTAPIYKPTQVGTYQLEVVTIDGCLFVGEFRTFDACNFSVIMPNAMVLGDSNRDFRVLVSEGVTEAELFIYSRIGELIYHEESKEIPVESPFFNWSGTTIRGEKVSIGTLTVVLFLRNPIYGFEEKLIGSLFVIE